LTNDDPGIRLAIHDATRFEWVAIVPLPHDKEACRYRVEFEVEVPAHLFSPQDHWRFLQVLNRLQSPLERAEVAEISAAGSPDELRELALAIAHRVKGYREVFTRECFLANSLLALEPNERRLAKLLDTFDGVRREIAEGRALLQSCPRGMGDDMAKELSLVDEFVSNQLLDFLFHARRAIDSHLLRKNGPHTEALREVATAFERAVGEGLGEEMAYRERERFITPTSAHPEVLERYLERSNLLKKHFHQLLFLHADQFFVDSKVRDYGAVVGAVTASLIGFALNATGQLSSAAGVGIGVAAFAGAAVYALQDRVKELGKTYLSGKLAKHYAQRVTKLILPDRRSKDKEGKLVGSVNEFITTKLQSRPDLLNPDLGARRDVYVLRYTAFGTTRPQPELRERGIACLKQVYRYDLSWLFARLDDALKTVPVFGKEGAFSLAEAARCYRMPAKVQLTLGQKTHSHSATVVMHKHGLERFEMEASTTLQAPSASASESLALSR
jgi:hypothetical protein